MSESAVRTVDVLIVGGNAAGLTAAVTARKVGLDVLVAEKTAKFGCTDAIWPEQIFSRRLINRS